MNGSAVINCQEFGPVRQFLFISAVFLIIYNLSLQGVESLPSARLVVSLLLIYFFVFSTNPAEILRLIDFRIFVLFLPIPYVFIQYLFVGDPGQLSRFFHLFLYSYVGAILIAKFIGGVDRWLWVFLVAVWVQAIFIFFSFFNLDYRGWVADNIATGGNFGSDYIYRAPGLTSTSGSGLSVIQSLGVLAGGLYLRVNKSLKITGQAVVFLMMLTCLISCIFVGRTGLIMSIAFVALFLLSGALNRRLALVCLAVLVVTIFAAGDFYQNMLPSDFSIDYFLGWSLGFFAGEDQTLKVLSAMPIAPLDIETFFGTGLVSLVDGINPSDHDSGFIQGYFSMGLPMVTLFYVSYFYVLFRLLRWLTWTERWFLLSVLYLIEVKEPFVFKYVTMFLLVGTYASWRQFLARRG